MNSNRALATAIRRKARERLKASSVLWKDYKRMRRARWRRTQLGRWAVMLYPVVILASLGQRASNELLLLLLTLYCTATIFARSARFASTLYRSADLALFMHVPVSDTDFFDYEWPRFLRASLFVWFAAASVFVSLAFRQGTPYQANLWAAMAAATLQWLVVVTFCVILHLLPPRFMNLRIAMPVYGLGFAAIFFPTEWVERLNTLVGPLPMAWVSTVFERGVLSHDTSTLPRVVAVVLLVAFLPLGYQRMRRAYPKFELAYPLFTARVGSAEEELAGAEKGGRTLSEAQDHAHEEAVMRPATPPAAIRLPSLHWETSGWIERLAGRWLNAREKYVAAFLCGGQLVRWSAAWRLGAKVALGGVLSMFLTALLPAWVCFAAGAVATLCAVPVFGGRWDGMQLVVSSGTLWPAYAGLPVSYSDITRVLFKINLVRYAVWAPIFVAYAAGLAIVMQVPGIVGVRFALELLAVLISAQGIFIMGQHANGTNDTRRLTWHSLVAIVSVLLLAIAYLASIGIFLASAGWEWGSESAVAAGTFAAMFFFSWLSWSVYRLFYNRGRVDLLRLPN